MARTDRNRVLHVRSAGKYANDQYALAKRVGHVVKKADRAKKRAVSGLRRRAPPMVKRAIVREYNIGKRKLSGRVKVRTTAVTVNIDASQLRFALSEFGGRWGGPHTAGATAEVARGQRQMYEHAFMAPGRLRGKKARLIYTRTGPVEIQKYGRYKGQLRESITVNRGPSVHSMVVGHKPSGEKVGPDLRDELEEQMIDYFVGELRRQYSLGGV